MPTISIIVPVHNAEDTLERCVESILAQTHGDLDIILIDDGSSDISGAMCDAYAEFDARVRAVHTSNLGLSAARNLGVESALKRGSELIAFADADDFMEPDMLEELLKELDSQSADIAQCGYRIEGLRKARDEIAPKAAYDTMGAIAALMEESIKAAIWNKLYRSRIFDNLRFPEGRVFEEIATTHLMLLECRKIVSIPYIGYHYVMREGSITHTISMKNLSDFWTAHKERFDCLTRKDQSLLSANHENILAQETASAASRVLRWSFSCGTEERTKHARTFSEISDFTKNDLIIYDTSHWPVHLKATLAIARNMSTPTLAIAYLFNQVFIRLFPGKSWNRF